MTEPRHRWLIPDPVALDPAFRAAAAAAGLGRLAATVLARRGIGTPAALDAFLAEGPAALHDPALLPDAAAALDRIARARAAGERVLVFGDFDADGLTGLAVMVRAMRHLGIDAVPYVPSRLDEGHGLSLAAVATARGTGVTLIVTVDTGSSSVAEVAAARAAGVDVLITDHHRVPEVVPDAVALVNPHRSDAAYPDPGLAGSGVAFTVARLLLRELAGDEAAALALADLATIGTVSDVAPVLGENRAIARLGLALLRDRPRPGLAALLARAGIAPAAVDLETVGFHLAPRLNAAGRMGEAMDAARLLLADDPAEAAALAATLDDHNQARRDLMRASLAEARALLGLPEAAPAVPDGLPPALLVRGEWPVGIVGLVAGRLADETGRPAIVATRIGDTLRASCRSDGRLDLAGALAGCADLLIRHGGHRAAAGFELPADRWDEFGSRFGALAAAAAPEDPRPPLAVDLALPARLVDYGLHTELARLAPFGPGHAVPALAVLGLTVGRVRAVSGGHTQLVLRRERDVLDGIAFGRPDLATTVREGDRVDVVARLASRRFGGLETLQLEVLDAAVSGSHPRAAAVLARLGTPAPAPAGAVP